MRAARLVQPGTITVDDVDAPSPGPDDVLITVGGVGLCGSDMSVFHGHWPVPASPWILGHEAFGRIDAVGERVPTSRIGEVVVVEPNLPCLRCAACHAGRTSGCVQRESLGMNRAGALAEKLVVPSAFAWGATDLGAADLVCVEPLTVVEAALRRLGPTPATSALVVGVGTQGLLMCLALAQRGIHVTVFDVNEERVALAATLGAVALAAGAGEPRFDLVVDTAGTPASVATALSHVASFGTLLVVGLDARPFELSAAVLVRRQLTLRGSLIYDHPNDFRAVLGLVQSAALSPGRVVTREYALTDVQEAFETSATASGKTWVRIDPTIP